MFDQRRAPVHTIKDMRMSKLGDVAAHIGLYPRKKNVIHKIRRGRINSRL
jgi:hypothetical protein